MDERILLLASMFTAQMEMLQNANYSCGRAETLPGLVTDGQQGEPILRGGAAAMH